MYIMETITTDELKRKMLKSEPVNIIDVRENDETALGIIPTAETVPMGEIPENLNMFNENDTYYIVCRSGRRSAEVANYLEEKGIHAVNVEGGMLAWGDEALEYKSI